ncbi:MAG: hypothetical protein ACKVS8_12360 [Phycisphaerales bacterium]
MSTFPRIAWLRWACPAAHAAALGAVARAGSTAERAAAWQALLGVARSAAASKPSRRLSAHATCELIRSAGHLHPSVTADLEGLRTLSGLVESAVAAVLRSDSAADRASAVDVVGRLGLLGSSLAVAASLDTADAHAADGAARCLLRLAERVGPMSRRARREEGASLLYGVLIEAAGHYDRHRQRHVLTALTLMEQAYVRCSPPRSLARQAWLTDESSGGLLALRRFLRSTPLPSTTAAAWVWLGRPTLAAASAVRLIEGSGDQPARDLAWRSLRFHLAASPARAAAMARLVSDDGGLPRTFVADSATLAGLPPPARSGYARLLGDMPGSSRLREAALGALVGDADAFVRHAAVRAACNINTRAGTLSDLCFDTDKRVARSAALALLARHESGTFGVDGEGTGVQGPLARALGVLSRSPDAVVARAAGDALAREDPLNAEHPGARLHLRRLFQRADGRADALVRHALRLEEGDRCVRAARAVRLLDVAPRFLDSLLAVLAQARDRTDELAERAGSAVLGSLADVPGDAVACAVAGALQAPSPRLRAAAIDAFVRRVRRTRDRDECHTLSEALAALRADEAHRPRGSAARGLLVLGSLSLGTFGAEHLGERIVVSMLRDDRAMHAAAGLWAAERLADRLAGHGAVMDAVSLLTRQVESKLDPIVATRCQRAAQRLVLEVRGAWVRTDAPPANEPAMEAAA